MSPLDRRYRRLLAWYPIGHRREYGSEMLGVLMAGSSPGQRWPRPGEALDVVWSAVRARFGRSGAGRAGSAWYDAAMSGATREDAGLASGLINTTAQVGAALGLAVLATLAASRGEHLASAGTSAAEALIGGYHLAFWVGAAVVVAAIAVALTVMRPERQPAGATAEPERDRELVGADA